MHANYTPTHSPYAKMQMAMNWDDLRHFLAIRDRGSISGAAARLGVNHSTVLRRIASLEQTLGVRLFERLPSGYAPTAAGHELAERLAGVSEQIEAAERRSAGGDLEIKGVLRLTTTDTLVHGLLMPALTRFCERHPRVQLQVAINNTFMNLTQREADVAVRGSNRPPENLIGRRVGNIRTAPYASRAYLKSLRRDASADDWRWVALDESLAHLEQAKWLRTNVAVERIAMRLDSLVAMVDAVVAGAGVGMLLTPLADARDGLVRLAEPLPQLDTQLWVLTHPDLRDVARVRALTDHLFDTLNADVRLDHGAPAGVPSSARPRRR